MGDQDKKINYWRAVGSLFAVFLFGVGILYVSSLLTNKSKNPEVIEKPIQKIDCPRSFEAYQDLINGGQFLDVLEDSPSYSVNGKFAKDYDITINRTGEIACGYLYVRARNDGHSLSEKYDSIYVNPQDLGGHLLRPRSMPVLNKIPGTTETLLPLNAIPYIPNVPYNPNAQDFKIANWVNLLNVTEDIKFNIALSTQDKTGVIDKTIIAYKCWNSQTGLETQDCKLSK